VADSDAGLRVLQVPVASIRANPGQPRQRLDDEGLEALAQSIREHGLLQPVLVRPVSDDAYELIAGERRWRAAQRAGLKWVPARLIDVSPRRALELALVENVQRADLTPLEEAEAYAHLIEALGLTQDQLARRLGMSRVAVTNRLRLLSLAPPVRDALGDGAITEGHARALLGLAREQQAGALAVVMAGCLSVRQTERLVRRMAGSGRRTRLGALEAQHEDLAERLRRTYGAQVRVRQRGAGVSVWLHFHSLEAAQQMLDSDGAPDDDL
jgi:ParB family chromosome partitioning protein